MDFSDSDDEAQLVVDDGNDESQVDDSICPICRGTTYVGETINCEKCSYWFHFECVGVTHSDACVQREDVPFYCSKCGGGGASKKLKKSPKKARKPKKSKSKKASMPPQQPPAAATSSKGIPPGSSPPIKLKISIGKKKNSSRSSIELSPPRHSSGTSSSSKRRSLVIETKISSNEDESKDSSAVQPPSAKRRKRQNSEEEEEKWLDAVESGNLHAVDDELKSIKDPKTMTARQRAMVDRKNNDDFSDVDIGHLSLSYLSAKKSKIVIDDEENQKIKAMKSAKRKEIELQKREEDRIKTMERLLNKKESTTLKNTLKSTSSTTVTSVNDISAAMIRKIVYIDKESGPTLTFPANMKIPIPTLTYKEPPPKIKCYVDSCSNFKKYNCSKTNRPLCSLSCYKKNLISIN